MCSNQPDEMSKRKIKAGKNERATNRRSRQINTKSRLHSRLRSDREIEQDNEKPAGS
jgi:hypothetical protein